MVSRPVSCLAPLALAMAVVAAGAGCNKKADSPPPARPANPGPKADPTAGATPSSPGQAVFQAHCTRCHTTTGQAQASERPKGKMQGPDLGKFGADPLHTREWLIAFVQDPQSQKPGARMPKFVGKVGNDDLEKLADYLLTLK